MKIDKENIKAIVFVFIITILVAMLIKLSCISSAIIPSIDIDDVVEVSNELN